MNRRVYPLRLLVGARLRAVGNLLANLRRESRLKVAVILCLGLGTWVMLFALFNYLFWFIVRHAGWAQEIIMQYALSAFFLGLILMLAFSNALISFGNLFRSPETAWLFSAPVKAETVFLYKLLDSLIFSSWAFFALGLPFLLAYGLQTYAAWTFYAAIALLVVPFVVIPAALGSLLGLVLTAVLPRRRGLGLALLALAVLGAGLWLGVDLWLSRPGMAWSRIESGRPAQGDVNMILGRLSFTQHPLSPNVWMTQGLLSSAKFGMREASQTGFFFVALAATAAFLTSLGWCLAGSLYGWTFSRALAARANRRVAGAALLERLISPLAVRWPAVTVLVVKEIKSFTRDPIQWSQALIFFGLLALYIANLRSFSYDLDQPLYKNLTSFLNLSATSLTLATLVTRFVFPSLSLEGPRFWVLGLAPVPRRKILLSKFVFSLGASLLVTESLVLLSNTILRAPRILLVGQVITAALISVGLTALAVGMGALFPNLRESNPSKIVSGFGGTLTLILSIGFVVLMVLPQGMLCHYYIVVWSGWRPGGGAESEFARALAVCLGVMALLTAAGSWLLLRLGARALDRLEF